MKAIVCNKYGGPEVLELKDMPQPQPAGNEVLIKIKATAVNSADCRLRRADPFAVRFFFGLTKPKHPIPGGVFSGEVVQTGNAVTKFKIGDEVFGSCGMSFGAYAEYKCLPQDGLMAKKPAHLSHAEAAVIPFGASTALYFLRKANVKPGQKVCIYGASGAVGTAAVQLANYYGAHVTAVCSTGNMQLVASLGAQKLIDYTKEDITANTERYDVLLDTVNKLPVKKAVQLLTPEGTAVLAAAMMKEMLTASFLPGKGRRKVMMGMAKETAADVEFLKQLAEEGHLKPVIDKTFSLPQMAAAHAYVDGGHKKGNVAVTV